MNKRRLRVLAIVIAVVMAVSSVITLANGRISWLPTWDELFAVSGFREAAVPKDELRVTVFALGDADCILLQSGDCAALVDAGNSDDAQTIISALQTRGVKRLDLVAATHFDSDHIGGMDDVIRTFEIGTFLTSHIDVQYRPKHPAYTDLKAALESKSIPVTEARLYENYRIGSAVITVLSETKSGAAAADNENSLVCRVSLGERSILLMGDADRHAEKQLLMRHSDLSADVLKVGHHGSVDASSLSFLEAVSPSYAVITCGRLSTSHPHAETIASLQRVGCEVLRTDLHGEIVVVTDGDSLTVTGKTF